MNNIPSEILLKIFQLIDLTAVLATCRSVCKSWNTLAAMVIFDRQIDVSTDQKAWKFFDYIIINPMDAKRVKSINFGHIDANNVELKRRILKLILNRNSSTIQGYYCEDSFYADMNSIIKSNMNNNKWSLHTIPHPTAITNHYTEAVILLADSLQDVFYDTDISVNPRTIEAALAYLDQFQNLTSLAIGLHSANALSAMLDILVDFPSIEELTIYASDFLNRNRFAASIRDRTTLPSRPTKSAIKALKIITSINDCVHFILQHFGNNRLKSVEINLDSDRLEDAVFEQMLTELDRTPHYVFEFFLDESGISLSYVSERIQSQSHIRMKVLNKYVDYTEAFGFEDEHVSYSVRLER